MAFKMQLNQYPFFDRKKKSMRSFLINKNLCFYYRLKRRIGEKWAFRVVSVIERVILIFGREEMPHSALNGNKVFKTEFEIFQEALKHDRL